MKKHILVIDNETVITQLLASLLALSSYKVSIALSGQDGIDLYRQDRPDLVIVDLFMPDLDGLAVIHTIKSEDPNAHFIALSGAVGGIELLNKAKTLGAQYAFEKPINNQKLLNAVAASLDF